MKKKTKYMIIALCFIIYLTAYIPCSVGGRYITANHGGNHWTRYWGPMNLVGPYRAPSGRQRETFTLIGFLYMPCIVLDRCFWHLSEDPAVDFR